MERRGGGNHKSNNSISPFDTKLINRLPIYCDILSNFSEGLKNFFHYSDKKFSTKRKKIIKPMKKIQRATNSSLDKGKTVVWKAANCKNRLSIFSNSFRFCQCQPIYELSSPVFPVFHRETVNQLALDCPFIGKLSSLQDYFFPSARNGDFTLVHRREFPENFSLLFLPRA